MRRLLEWEREAISQAFRDGEKRAAIAAEFGADESAISHLAKRRGIPSRLKTMDPTRYGRRTLARQRMINIRQRSAYAN